LASLIRLLTPVVETHPRALMAYAPKDGVLAEAIGELVKQAANEMAARLLVETGADHELRTVVTKLEPDTVEKPFASVQILIEIVRVASRQTVYTRKVESEVRRLIQAPVPLDDPRFPRTALGRATVSCLRSLFTAVTATFGSV
jgi:hypothetical protein